MAPWPTYRVQGSGSFIQLEVNRPVRGLISRVQRQPSISFQAPVKRTSSHSIMSKTKQHWRSTYCETWTLLCSSAGSQNLYSTTRIDRSFPLLNRSVCGQVHGHLLTGLCFPVPSLTSSGIVRRRDLTTRCLEISQVQRALVTFP